MSRQVVLAVWSWTSNLLNAVQFPVSLITLRDLTQKCRIQSLIGTDITVYKNVLMIFCILM